MVRLSLLVLVALMISCMAAPGERVRRYYNDGGLGGYGGGGGGGGGGGSAIGGGYGGHGGQLGHGFGQWPSVSQSFSKSSASSSSVSSGGTLAGKK